MPDKLEDWKKRQRREYNYSWDQKTMRKHGFHEWIKEIFPYPENKLVVEIGIGPGGCLRETHDNLIGLDPLMCKKYIRAGFYKIGIKAMGEYLPIRDNTFDVIYCVDVLNHALNEFEIVKEIYRILKYNGELYFLTNFNSSDLFHHKIDKSKLRSMLSEYFDISRLREDNDRRSVKCLVGVLYKK